MTARTWAALIVALLLLPGCEPLDKPTTPEKPAEKPAEKPKPVEGEKKALNKQQTLFLETMPDKKRRVRIEANVCLTEGQLELLMCRKQTKEHEAILHADVDAEQIHAALMVCQAKPGSPVKFVDEKILPPTGTTIKITLQYEKKPGEVVMIDAKEWLRHAKTRKALDRDWVFAGSALFKDEDDPKKTTYYLANNGNVISLANFNDAMLDLPFASSKDNDNLLFECWTERIPPLKTKVTVILEPVLEEKK